MRTLLVHRKLKISRTLDKNKVMAMNSNKGLPNKRVLPFYLLVWQEAGATKMPVSLIDRPHDRNSCTHRLKDNTMLVLNKGLI